MGFFGSIGKVFKKVGSVVSGVAKKALPSVLSVAKLVPGVGTIASAAEMGIGMLSGGGGGSEPSPFVAEIARASGVNPVGSAGSGRTAAGRKKVVIWK